MIEHIYLSKENAKVSSLFIKVLVTADYCFSSIKALPRKCYRWQIRRLALENTAASYSKLRSNLRGGTHGGVPLCHVVFRTGAAVIARPNLDFD